MISRRALVLATRNRDKIREMQENLAALPIRLLTLDDFPHAPEVVEDGDTLEANARKKAIVIHQSTGLPALADDTGLFVHALNGAPGVFSARFAGEKASYSDNVQKLLAEMKSVPTQQRGAEFRCVMAFANDEGVHFIKGACPGDIAFAPKGDGQFGYDPIFIAEATQKTFAEMTLAEKNLVSHRGLALAAFQRFLIKHWFEEEVI